MTNMAVRPNKAGSSGGGSGSNQGGGRGGGASGGGKGKDRKEVQALIEVGKSKGFLTYDEVNDALPHDLASSADQLDDVIGALGDEDIEIVDATTQVKIAPKRIADEEAEGHKKVAARGPEEIDDSDGLYSK